MAKERVVLLSNHSLLAAGILSLLEGVDGLEVAVVSVDDPDASCKMRHFAPHVIVLDGTGGSSARTAITQLLKQNPVARIVSLNLGHRDVEVFRMERLTVSSSEEFLAAIRSQSPNERGKGAELTQGHYASEAKEVHR